MFLVVLPLLKDVQEVVNLRRLDVGSGAMHQNPIAQRTVQQAYALIREDIDQCNVERTDLVAQAIH